MNDLVVFARGQGMSYWGRR